MNRYIPFSLSLMIILQLVITVITAVSTPIVFRSLYPVLSVEDKFGWSDTQRTDYAQVIVTELSHFSESFAPTALGTQLTIDEVDHLTDVKRLLNQARLLTLLSWGILISYLLIWKPQVSHLSAAIKRSLLIYGSLTTLTIVFLFFFWQTSFVFFHQLFFPNGNWSFYENSTLIRLFPETFWQRIAGLCILLPFTFLLGFFLLLSFCQKYTQLRMVKY